MNDPLRACPTCGTKVSDVAMGLRDYQWVSKGLPGRIAPMDIDFVLERKGHHLAIEFKPPYGLVNKGATITYKSLVAGTGPWDVWVVREMGGPDVEVAPMHADGGLGVFESMKVPDLAGEIHDWYREASRS